MTTDRVAGECVQPRRVAYRELADQLRSSLRAGGYADGRRLPTELELAELHDVSRQTVRRAMQELVADGVIYRVAGRGTFAVTEPGPYMRHIGSVTDLMGLSQDTQLRVVAPLRRRVVGSAGERLGIGDGSLATLTFTRHHDGVAFCLTTVYLPLAVADLLADVPALRRKGARTMETVIGLLDRRIDKKITRADQTITAVPAPSEVQAYLGAAPGDAVLSVERLYRDEDGRAIELAISHFLPAHYAYRVTLRRDPR
jgi:DNA-binding GntR family transcriptional regulator